MHKCLENADAVFTPSSSGGSQSGVCLRPRGVIREIVIPSLALRVKNVDITLFHPSLIVTNSLEECHPQPSSNVPCDVAVHSGNIESAGIVLDMNGLLIGTYSQAPGLSVLNARSSHPAAGSMVTSRLTGLLPFSLEASKAYLVCVAGAESGDRPTTRKSCPLTNTFSKSETIQSSRSTYVEVKRMWDAKRSLRIILDEPVNPLVDASVFRRARKTRGGRGADSLGQQHPRTKCCLFLGSPYDWLRHTAPQGSANPF